MVRLSLEVLLSDRERADGEGCALGAAAGRAQCAFLCLFIHARLYALYTTTTSEQVKPHRQCLPVDVH
jgi:hypothetical protein